MTDARVAAFKDLEAPTTLKELERLLGLIVYLNPHIPRSAEIVQPLRDFAVDARRLHRRKFTLGEPQLQAFDNIKKAMVDPKALAVFNPLIPVRGHVDASGN